MKAAIAYPPIVSQKGVPLLSQNRQFQWFHKPTYVYPMVPAYAATMAKQSGHEVLWADGIARNLTPEYFNRIIADFEPDICLIEAKTPIRQNYWESVNHLKKICPEMKIALCGDHVTALPEETMQKCNVDFVFTGGDYDFTLVDMLQWLNRKRPDPETMPPGVFFRDKNRICNTGPFQLSRDLDLLPIIDRDLTQWQLYSTLNGNYRYTPGTYTMFGRDCWWGKCVFCAWTTLYNKWRAKSAEKALDEIGHIIDNYPVREIFDDTGCFPAGQWLKDFCNGMIKRGYNKRVVMGCNMIPGVLSEELYDLMAEANFRFLLFGLESAEQSTLDRINKCGKAKDIENSMKLAKRAGLEPHVTCMVGYPWETREQARNTVNFTKRLFRKGYIDTLQATVVVPYPGTPLFKECKEKGWLKTEDWDKYDMREPVMKTEMGDEEVLKMTRGIYSSFMTPAFLIRKLLSIRSFEDVRYYLKAAIRVLGHLTDFRSDRGQHDISPRE